MVGGGAGLNAWKGDDLLLLLLSFFFYLTSSKEAARGQAKLADKKK